MNTDHRLVALPERDRTDFAGSTDRFRRLAITIHDILWSRVNDKNWAPATQRDLAADLGTDQGAISRAIKYGSERGWYMQIWRGYGSQRGQTRYLVENPANVDRSV